MRNLLVTLVTLAVLGGIAILAPGVVPVPLRQALGIGLSPLEGVPEAGGTGTYEFLQHQPGSPDAPVTYDPCKRIEVEINTDGVSREGLAKEIVLSAMKRVRQLSGLRLEYAGSSTARPQWRTRTQPALGGSTPVLVSFASSDEVPELAGRIAGIGGSTSVRRFGTSTYVTGQVTLDSDTFDRLMGQRSGPELARAIALHELGHLVGLDHVDDDNELMSAENRGRLDFGPGDRRGLVALGRGPCR